MRDLSVIIPARNETFLQQTITNALDNIKADTEIIAICDGYWPEIPVQDHPRVTIVHHTEPIGQRAATNEGVRMSQAKYVMKLDAHCAVSEGFDVNLIKDCKPNWTMVPMMYHLHAFDWKCSKCGNIEYQGKKPDLCKKCNTDSYEMDIVWKPRWDKKHVTYRFDETLHFQYWRKHDKKRMRSDDRLVKTMSFIGACMLLERDRYWELDGCDEGHGSWGQFGTEWACKSWLSGGALIGTKDAWFAHMFRTGNFKGAFGGASSFPYKTTFKQQEYARTYSRDFWFNDKWPKAKHSVQWLVDKFKPVPGWHDDK